MNPIGATIGALLLALALACPSQRQASVTLKPAETTCAYSLQGTLGLAASGLSYRRSPDETPSSIDIADALPYQIVALGPPTLVTTCGTDLVPCTYALDRNAAISAYPGWVPQLVQGRVAALAPVVNSGDVLGLGVILLNTDGSTLLRENHGMLLNPVNSAGSDTTYVVVSGKDGALLAPFGSEPELVVTDPLTGNKLRRIGLSPRFPVVDVVMWGEFDGCLLISLQYDYEMFEFISLSCGTWEELARWQLTGIPGGATVYPGPGWEPQAPESDGARAGVLVYNSSRLTWERWELDCATGALEQAACPPPETLREDNPLPVGGEGMPGPGSAPFPQRLLPVACGNEWVIDALTDSAGRVLVVDSAGARWVALGN